MLDLNFMRANLELVEEKLRMRGEAQAALLGDFRELDLIRRQRITQAENLKRELNRLSEEVAHTKRAGGDATEVLERTRTKKAAMEGLDRWANEAEAAMRSLLARIPNLTQESVPPGRGEEDNLEICRWGELPRFQFQPKPHWELGAALGILDLERAAKIAGARFAVYWDLGARLERALANFMLDLHTREHGYREVLPPFLVNSASLFGTGQLPKFAEDLFRCADEDIESQRKSEEEEEEYGAEDINRERRALFNDHWLIPTAEVPLTNLYRDEVLDEDALPVSLTAYTPCFRSEAGSYGKDVRGIIRQHQFQKVEMVKFVVPEQSNEEHERLTGHAQHVLENLELPYRKVLLCAGDTGAASAKTYDLEVWLPGQGLYREISSCSNYEAYQARRANIRYKPRGGNKPEFVHTLNGSGLAVGRTWLAILENYQQADGTVRVPEALVPYMGGERVIGPRDEK